MSKKLEKIEADLARARAKREAWEQRVKELEQKYTAEENSEIHEVVRSFNLTPEELRELLKNRNGRTLTGFPEPVKGEPAAEQEVDHEEV
ncbi:MAG: DUF4315 family protein [Lachnospiraceae bacterium]|nr:DUF4315 family protein [Lachnospiraceae bacterium]